MAMRSFRFLCIATCLVAYSAQCHGARSIDSVDNLNAHVVTEQPQPFGIGVSGRYLNPVSTLAAFPGIPTCCDLLSPTQGWAGSLMGEYTHWVSKDITLEGALGITWAASSLASSSFVGYALDGTDEYAKVVRAESQTRVSLSSYSVEGRLIGSWLLGGDSPSQPHLYGGISANYVLSAMLEQREELLSPASAVFEDTRTNARLVYAESVTSRLQPWLTISAGAGVTLFRAERVDIRTRLSAELPITKIVSESGKGLAYGLVRLDVSVLFKRTSDVVPPPPPPLRERPLAASLSLKARTGAGTLRDTAVIDVTRALGTRVYSLLPFVFFSRGSAEINGRYIRLTKDAAQAYRPTISVPLADTSSVSDTQATLELYYNLLNIVGRRMREEYPSAELTITGYCDNQGVERNGIQLSTQRAIAVRNYLRDVWQLDTSRLIIASGLLSPTAASTTMPDERDRADGHEENRRVELTSSVAEVLDPVVITDTLLSVTRPELVIQPRIASDSSDHAWQLLTQCGTAAAIHQVAGSGSPMQQYLLDSAMCPVLGGRDQSEILSKLNVRTHDGRQVDAFASIPVRTVTRNVLLRRTDGDTTQYRFRLTQFQYNNQRMLAAQSSIIQRYITPLLPDNATIEIIGYTDRKGSSELNLKLAQDRVREIQTAFSVTNNSTTLAVGEGTDTINAPFDNATPEGRLYNRTVEIRVLIPVTTGR